MKAMCAVLILLSFLAPDGHAQESKDGLPTGAAAMQAVQVTATVDAVDRENRIVTLKDRDGESISLRVGDEVRNLDRLAPGDLVEIDYFEAVALELKQSDSAPTASETTTVTRAKPGAKPGGMATRKIRMVTEVMGVNPETQSILVRGPQGNLTRIKVNDPARLAQLQTGGLIDVTYTESLAIAVRAKQSQ